MSTATLHAGFTRPRRRACVTGQPVRAVVPSGARPAPVRHAPARPVTARRARPTATRRAPVRLTRRGRLVVVLTVLALALAVLTVFGPHSAATGEVGVPVQTRTVEVGAGDTVWGIASRVAAPGEVRDMVQRIEELNAMSGPGVTVGQEIAVPVG